MVGKSSGETRRTKRLIDDTAGTLVLEFLDLVMCPDGKIKTPFKGKGAVCAKFSEVMFRYLESYNIGHHFLAMSGDSGMKVRRLEMLPLSVRMRNMAAGDLAERFALQEGQALEVPVMELYLKRPDLAPTMVNGSHCLAFHLAGDEELRAINRMASKVNAVLRSFFDRRDIQLVELTLEFGRHQGNLLVGDEISPDTCRLWDRRTRRKFDVDSLRSGTTAAEAAYRDVLEKVQG